MQRHTYRIHRPHRDALDGRGAFTLVELLVVTAKLSLLLGVLVPALAGVRGAASATKELTIAQQTMIAYTMYSDAHRGVVLPGFAQRPGPNDRPLAIDERGEPIGPPMSQRYPWRLAPYLDYNVTSLIADQEYVAELRHGSYEDLIYSVSVAPSLGINQTFVGGSADSDPTGVAFEARARSVWGDSWYVQRVVDVDRPSSLITFASAYSLYSGRGGQTIQGGYRVTPPYFVRRIWRNQPPDELTPSGLVGGVSLRHSGKAVVALFDAHAEIFTWKKMQDMRHWAPTADAPDWTMPNPSQ
jgi:prepilin-type processing-associated H-X9-DG protein